MKYINSGIKLDNNSFNQKLQHIYVMTKWMANNSKVVTVPFKLSFQINNCKMFLKCYLSKVYNILFQSLSL